MLPDQTHAKVSYFAYLASRFGRRDRRQGNREQVAMEKTEQAARDPRRSGGGVWLMRIETLVTMRLLLLQRWQAGFRRGRSGFGGQIADDRLGNRIEWGAGFFVAVDDVSQASFVTGFAKRDVDGQTT
ncbi:hypothetical protein Poly59_07120 [Rubripirellula reticaptiva]|uniref:Uncharacterized protein n=1 Tax=Rubripirellula reticaptiva TaxID=2528013 RepID=A0A5C6F7V4_9BACT|nr:hypothetical protein Poly59_07120 [Rubripirellula reticaptiva]